jgi:hypothetical protein
MISVTERVTLDTVDIDRVQSWCYNNLGSSGWTLTYVWDSSYHPVATTVILYSSLEIPLDQVKVLFMLSWNNCRWQK